MDPGASSGDSSASAAGFFSEVIFTWIPNALMVVFESVQRTASDPEASIPSPLVRPLNTADFVQFLEQTSAPGVYDSLVQGWHSYVFLAIAFSLPFLAVSSYCTMRVFLLRREEERMFRAAQEPVAAGDIPRTRLRWNRVLEHARGDSEHNWRLAILEADIMLNELLDTQGYKGETMADKMKQVDRADFNSIDAAWEAHKFRNKIAHGGLEHPLPAQEVRRIIGLYEQIFREFRYLE